jgi:hypothetical protein
MEKQVKFYNPHPGFGGALLPLPTSMKRLADSLDGQVMTLEQAIEKLTPAAKELDGILGIVEEYRYIGFEFRKDMTHSYRLIDYEEI